MSLHATLSTEAQAALDAQKKKSTIYSIIIAILTCVLLGIILSVLVLVTTTKKAPEIIGYSTGEAQSEVIEKPEIVNEVSRKPSAPSALASVIATNANSDISVPTIDFNLDEASLDFGQAEDFGEGIDGSDFGNFTTATGAAGGFGSSEKVLGTIEGSFYDFKQTPEGKPNSRYKPMTMETLRTRKGMSYPATMKSIRNSYFRESSLKDFYRAERPLYARYFAIPMGKADSAPRQFGQGGKVQPSNWMIHYKGKVKAPKTGTFRFAGMGDDVITVNINRRSVFTASVLAEFMPSAVTIKGKGSGPNVLTPFHKVNLAYGTWFNVREGEVLDIDIAISEAPGGDMYFMLMLEEQGASYRKGKDAAGKPRDILPPFAMGNLTPEDKQTLKKFPKWEWETENVPVFMAIQ